MLLKGSETEKNLMKAFAGESQARNQYTYFSQQAKKEGHDLISKYFDETANNELEHAKIWYKLLNEGKIPGPKEALKRGVEAENYEATKMYLSFADTAEKEGFLNISYLFKMVANIEKAHRDRYQKLLLGLENKIKKPVSKKVWECSNCGHEIVDTTGVTICPVCQDENAFFFEKHELL